MMLVLLYGALFLVGLFVLVRSSDAFVDYAKELSLSFGVSPFVVGITIVSVGTSLPELVTSVIAVTGGSSDLVLGNVMGSNIANVFFIGGIGALIAGRLRTKENLMAVDLPFFVGTALLLGLIIMDATVSLFEGILLCVCLILYVVYAASKKRAAKEHRTRFSWVSIFGVLLSGVLIYFSAQLSVQSIVRVGELVGIATSVLGASVVALGTSFPELFVTIAAARKNETDIVLGNILGSNIFNILGVVGIPRLFGALAVSPLMLTIVLPIMITATLLFFVMVQERELSKWEGMFLLLLYVFFLSAIF